MLSASCMANEENDHKFLWDKYLPMALFAYHCSVQKSTGYTPFQIIYGYEVQNMLSLVKDI